MKVNELRIGNFVYFIFNNEKIIHSIVSKDIHVMHMCERDYNEESECYYPIPLTEDLLLKGGSKKHRDKFFSKSIGKGLTLEISLHYKRTIIFSKKMLVFMDLKPIKFVHEWQNLYYDLSGEELTIVE